MSLSREALPTCGHQIVQLLPIQQRGVLPLNPLCTHCHFITLTTAQYLHILAKSHIYDVVFFMSCVTSTQCAIIYLTGTTYQRTVELFFFYIVVCFFFNLVTCFSIFIYPAAALLWILHLFSLLIVLIVFAMQVDARMLI